MKLEEIEQDLEQSIHIRGKEILARHLISFGLGAGFGALGKHTRYNELPAVPLVMDLIGGRPHISAWLSYGAGVAMNYLPEIYQAIRNM